MITDLIWRINSSRVLISDKWLRVRADACESSEGAKFDPYYVIESPDFVVMFATTTDNHLVLVRQYRHAASAVTLELPAGRLDHAEDPIAAAQRELLEETGYAGGSATVLRSLSPNAPRYANRMHVVLIENVELVAAPKDDIFERIHTVLLPMERASELLADASFLDAAMIGALALGLANVTARGRVFAGTQDGVR
jgi:8-oxo-dGTP pyrophosphatase MutT (NUDIX family)